MARQVYVLCIALGRRFDSGQNEDQSEDRIIGKGVRKVTNRALRLQELCPDLSTITGMTQLTLNEAEKFGGYKNSRIYEWTSTKEPRRQGKPWR